MVNAAGTVRGRWIVSAAERSVKGEQAIAILRKIVDSVEALSIETPENDLTRDGGEEYHGHWFGWFEASHTDDEPPHTEAVQWPNLGILIEQAKEVLSQ